MNIAFQALVIFALVLPGIILKNSYRRGTFWDRPRQVLAIADEIAYSLLLAASVHAVFASVAHYWFWPIDLNAVVLILLGQFGRDASELSASVAALTSHPLRVFLYFASVYLGSAALGFGAHWVVRHFRLDIKFPALRFDHQWHYLLRGDIGLFPESSFRLEEDIDAIFAACVVDTSAGTFLYVGVLDSFYFDKAGTLDLLVLTAATRRPIDPMKEDAEGNRPEYFEIDAEYLYLKYSDVKNVSIHYVRVIEEPVAAGPAT